MASFREACCRHDDCKMVSVSLKKQLIAYVTVSPGLPHCDSGMEARVVCLLWKSQRAWGQGGLVHWERSGLEAIVCGGQPVETLHSGSPSVLLEDSCDTVVLPIKAWRLLLRSRNRADWGNHCCIRVLGWHNLTTGRNSLWGSVSSGESASGCI